MIKELADIMKEVENMKKEVEKRESENSLAWEMLKESKKQHARDFIEKIILVFLLALCNVAWIIYINQFDFTTETNQKVTDAQNSHIEQRVN